MRTLLLTPSPLTTTQAARAALGRDWGSRDPAFIALTGRQRPRTLMHGAGTHGTVPVAGSGTFAVESAVGTLVPRDGKLPVPANGAHGRRIGAIARRAVVETWPETEPVDTGRVRAILRADPGITDVAMVHCEATTGLLNPPEAVAAVAQGRRLPIDLREIGASAVVASSSKCLEGVPGIGMAIAERAHLAPCAGQSRSLGLDLHAQWASFERNGQWRFIPPVQAAALDAALDQLDAGGWPGRAAGTLRVPPRDADRAHAGARPHRDVARRATGVDHHHLRRTGVGFRFHPLLRHAAGRGDRDPSRQAGRGAVDECPIARAVACIVRITQRAPGRPDRIN